MSILNIVDEQGNVVGEDSRENIHGKGLLHREIHVWFYTPNGEIIFQHRAKNKDAFPDMLDATVRGHVEIGSNFEETALKEMEEETGVIADLDVLRPIKTIRSDHLDPITGKRNNVFRRIFAYKYTGRTEDLKTETGMSEGFEAWPIIQLENIDLQKESKFIPGFLDKEYIEMYKSFLTI